MPSLDAILETFGYVPEDDAWDTDGRRTYVNEDPATRPFMRLLGGALSRCGWDLDKDRLRTFRHFATAEIIEIEPGGDEVAGHLLHHMKAETVV